MIDRSLPVISNASSAPTPADGSVEMIVRGCSRLVQRSEYDVDRDQRGGDQQRLRRQRLLHKSCVAGKLRAHILGHPKLAHGILHRLLGVAECHAWCQVETQCRRRELPLMANSQGRRAPLETRNS